MPTLAAAPSNHAIYTARRNGLRDARREIVRNKFRHDEVSCNESGNGDADGVVDGDQKFQAEWGGDSLWREISDDLVDVRNKRREQYSRRHRDRGHAWRTAARDISLKFMSFDTHSGDLSACWCGGPGHAAGIGIYQTPRVEREPRPRQMHLATHGSANQDFGSSGLKLIRAGALARKWTVCIVSEWNGARQRFDALFEGFDEGWKELDELCVIEHFGALARPLVSRHTGQNRLYRTPEIVSEVRGRTGGAGVDMVWPKRDERWWGNRGKRQWEKVRDEGAREGENDEKAVREVDVQDAGRNPRRRGWYRSNAAPPTSSSAEARVRACGCYGHARRAGESSRQMRKWRAGRRQTQAHTRVDDGLKRDTRSRPGRGVDGPLFFEISSADPRSPERQSERSEDERGPVWREPSPEYDHEQFNAQKVGQDRD
ncbi:hypothetical protein FB451DRAFT_1378174 [Mycena latifolia]|nr:hypothetical protein FB451DRAFT_1378174 [Mycena latifolia]